MPRHFSFASDLAIQPSALWKHAVEPIEINAEFRPWLSMSFPRDMGDITVGWEPGVVRFRSWIRLGALIPVEFDDVTFDKVEEGRFFQERSTMLTQARWEHRREISKLPGGSRLEDKVSFTSRIQLLEPAFEMIFRGVFHWRHGQLRRIHGQLNTETR